MENDMEDKGPRTSVRWGKLYPALTAAAEKEGISRAELVREAVRLLLKGNTVDVPERPAPTSKDNATGKIFVRAGTLIEDLEARAIKENRSVSVIVRKAIRFYLGQTRIPEVKQFLTEINTLTDILSRIGCNLNQVALAFNMDDILNTEDLAQVHSELTREFRDFSSVLIAIRTELEKQRP